MDGIHDRGGHDAVVVRTIHPDRLHPMLVHRVAGARPAARLVAAIVTREAMIGVARVPPP
jgi:hypothetical protein